MAKYRMSFKYPNGQRGALTYPSKYEADYRAERVRRSGGTAEVRKVTSIFDDSTNEDD